MEYLGRNGSQVLFISNELGAIVDEVTNSVVAVASKSALVSSAQWLDKETRPQGPAVELALAAMTDLDIKVFSNNDRMYTVPESVQSEAKRALEWRRKEGRGGTPVGLNTARTLAKGGQIGIRKVRHIAKYFPRHQVDKKGKGYKPGDSSYPSNGRIAWALWGGDAAERWASAIVERENKKEKTTSIIASYSFDGYGYSPEKRIDLDAFYPREVEPDFYIRIRLDGSGIDRLYKTDTNGDVSVWDDSCWDDLGNINHDFVTYDKSLDDPYDSVKKLHVPVDRESALQISAMLDNDPFKSVLLQKVNFDESRLMEKAIPDMDWNFLDSLTEETPMYVDEYGSMDDSLTAAGEAPAGPPTNQDGNYTPEERSEKAQGQVRDKTGKFAKAGSTVVIGGNEKYTGTIRSIDPATQNLKVDLADGTSVDVPANLTQEISSFEPINQPNFPESDLDFSGILGEPRVPIDQPNAQLPGRLPPLTAADVNLLVNDWSAWVAGQTLAPEVEPTPPPPPVYKELPDANTALGKYYQGSFNPDGTVKPSWNPATAPNVYNDPLLRDWLDKKLVNKAGETAFPNRGWYQPEATPDLFGKGVNLDPKKARDEAYSKENVKAYDDKYNLAGPIVYGKDTSTPSAPSTTSPKTTTQPVSTTKNLPNGVTQSGTTLEPKYTKNINGNPVETDKNGTPIKGTYIDVPSDGYKTGGKIPTTIYQGESTGGISSKGELGSVVQKFTDNAGKEIVGYKGASGETWFGQRGVVVPKGFTLYEDGSIGPKDPKNPPKGSYDSSKVGPNGQKGNAVETFTDSVTNQVRTKYSDGKSTWYGSKGNVVAEGFRMEEDGSLSRVSKPVRASGMTAAAPEEEITPENSPVAPMYVAIVAPDDPQAVMELVSVVPVSKRSSQPSTFKRKDRKWLRDDRILSDLNSPTPPPVVVLDNANLAAVLEQVDGGVVVGSVSSNISVALTQNAIIASLAAAGGADRNRGNAEDLRRYWTTGKGGVKIRWNSKGDWTRCHKYLSKYLGPRAKGYCALRHKEMTGMWPGDKNNPGMKKSLTSSIETLKSEQSIVSEYSLKARAESARSRIAGREGVTPEEYGSKFTIPLVIPEGMESGDGRIFNKGSISMRDLPLPLLWQIKTGEGHNGSVVVGQILSMERVENGIGNAYGVFDLGENGKEAERLVKNGFIRGVSADMDMFEADEAEEVDNADDSEDTKKIGAGRISITKARVMAVTIVPKPAFQECFIQIVSEPSETQEEEEVLSDGVYVEGVNPLDASALVACGIVAGMIPVEPPMEWFENPNLKKATPLTVSDDGQVFGHIAAWHVDHIGMSFGTRPPRSKSNYSYFHTGVVRTLEGKDMPVGQLTLAGGHASLEASASEAVRHYDDTASAIADVHAGEDAFGIWVSGALRPGTSPEQVRALRASAPSGDWRPIKGQLELVAVCQVNVPGFPIARARVASGQVMALVAAGASTLAQLKHDPLAELTSKINKLEQLQKEPLLAAAFEAKARINAAILSDKQEELASKVRKVKKDIESDSDYMNQMLDDNPENELAVVSRKERLKLAGEKKALPDGSFPIRNISDLKNAIQAYGRAKPGKRGVVKKHIMRRAHGLDRKDLIPENWVGTNSSDDPIVASLEERIANAQAILNASTFSSTSEAVFELNNPEATFAELTPEQLKDLTPEEIEALKVERLNRAKKSSPEGKYTPDTQPRDTKGKFRQVLARLKNDLGDSGLDSALNKIEEAENLDNAGNYKASADAAGELIGIIDRLDTKALNPESLENVRNSAGELGKVIANLPFAFGKDAEKIRFSDVPPALQNLMLDMIKKVEDKIGQEDADVATEQLQKFLSGSELYNQSEISGQMAKLLRLLT